MTAAALTFAASAVVADEQHIFMCDDLDWQAAGLEGADMAILWGSEEDKTTIQSGGRAYNVPPDRLWLFEPNLLVNRTGSPDDPRQIGWVAGTAAQCLNKVSPPICHPTTCRAWMRCDRSQSP